MKHVSVLLQEVIDIYKPFERGVYIDCTLGAGGHSREILNNIKGKDSGLIAIDLDARAVENFAEYVSKHNLERQVEIVKDNFVNIAEIWEKSEFKKRGLVCRGVIMDLGFSLDEIETSGKGFSFLRDEPLLMTYGDPSQYSHTAYDIVNSFPKNELVRIFRIYGEERDAERVAVAILKERKHRKISTTRDLVEIVLKAKKISPHARRRQKIHPATKIFQALRITVNKELDNIKQVLKDVVEILGKGGRIAVISFHSLEDRIVKQTFKYYKDKGVLEVLTPKPVVPSREENAINPRSRSGKMRAAEKM